MLGFRRNNRVVGFEVVEHSGFDEVHGGGCRVVVEDRWENPREISVHDFERRLSGGCGDGGVNGEFDGRDKFRPIRTVPIDVIPERLEDRPIRAFRLTIRLGVKSRRHQEVGTE